MHKKRKREGEEHVPLPALVRAAPPTLRAPGRGRADRRAQMAAMAPGALGLSSGLGSYPATPSWGAVVFVWLFLGTLCTGTQSGALGVVEGPEGTVRRGKDGVLHQQGGRRAGGGGSAETGTSRSPESQEIPCVPE